MTINNGGSLLAGITSGIANTYSYLASQYPNGLTVENLNEAKADSSKAQYFNQSFASYLQTNFANIDSNNDGIITADEMNKLSNRMATEGLTKEELTQMFASGASGISTETLSSIMEHFDEIDANHDGKITSTEINAYNVDSSKQQKMDEFANKRATDMSVFYGSESSDTDSYSLLSYKYTNSNNNN